MRKKFPTKKGIIFVDDDSNVIVERPASIQRPHKWRDIIIGVFVSITLFIMGLGGWRLYNYYYNIGVPVSVTPEENIQNWHRMFPAWAIVRWRMATSCWEFREATR